mgnify:CR=1 FL=1
MRSDESLSLEADDLLIAGNRKSAQGDAAGALQLYQRLRACGKLIHDKEEAEWVEGCALNNLGNTYKSLEQYQHAIEHLTQALAISRKLGDLENEGLRLGNLGVVYDCQGQYELAIKQYTRALAISREVGDPQGEGNQLGNLGNTFTRLGQYKDAIKYLKQALAISSKLGEEGSWLDRQDARQNAGTWLGHLGNVYVSVGKYECAIEHYEKALAISRNLHDMRGECSHLGGIGIACCNLGQYERAIEHHKQALEISRRSEVADRRGESNQLGSLGNIYFRQGHYELAIEHYKQARAISCEVCDRQGESSDLYNIGYTYLELNDPTAALPWFQQSRAVFDTLWADLATDERRVSYGDTFYAVACQLQCTHARLSQPEAALQEAERARSRSFEVLLAQQRIARGGAVAVTPATSAVATPLGYNALQKAAERELVTIIVYSQVRPSQLLVWIVRSDAPLEMKQLDVPSDDKSLTQLVELTRRTIFLQAGKSGARQGEVLARSSGLERFVDHAAFAPLTVDEAALDEALSSRVAQQRDIEMLEDDNSGDSQKDATVDPLTALLKRCYELLIAPLGLSKGEALLLVPDRDLYALPFAALLGPDDKHLIEVHSLRIAPSVGTVIELEARAGSRAVASGRSLVVGNPTFHWAPGAQLLDAETEAKHVAATLTASPSFKDAVSTLIGDAATKRAVVEAMRGCDVVHLATHGTPDSVLLGGATRVEGALTMAEVQALDLSAQLVVLSECNSFRGKLTADGIIGITRAFVAAGALTLVASLWKVDDAATCELMTRFYKRLLADGKMGDAAMAMQGAMVSMIHERKSGLREGRRYTAWHWASFVVYGLAHS